MNDKNENSGADCAAMARALENMMTIANISGFVSQNDGRVRQFENSKIKEHRTHATLQFDFDGKHYVANVFCDTSEEPRNENG